MSTYQEAVDEHSPSNWIIISNDGTDLVAHNSKTNREFSGTTEEFNQYVKLQIRPPVKQDYDIVSGAETGKILLRDPATFYVRHDGCNGDGLHNTADSAFNDLASIVDYIFATYKFRADADWPFITIKMVGDWNYPWVELSFPSTSYVSVHIEFENKYTNFLCGSFTGSAFAEVIITNATLNTLYFADSMGCFISSCVFAGAIHTRGNCWANVGNCEINAIPNFYGILAAWNNSSIAFYDAFAEGAVTLKFTASVGNNLIYSRGGAAIVDLRNLAFDLNGFTYTGHKFEVSFNAIIYKPEDATKSFLPGTAGIERDGGTYIF